MGLLKTKYEIRIGSYGAYEIRKTKYEKRKIKYERQ